MISAHLLGYIAALVTTFIYLPQAYKTMKVKHTKGVAHLTYYLAISGSFLWFIYGVMSQDFPIIISNGIIFCTASFTLYFLFKHS